MPDRSHFDKLGVTHSERVQKLCEVQDFVLKSQRPVEVEWAALHIPPSIRVVFKEVVEEILNRERMFKVYERVDITTLSDEWLIKVAEDFYLSSLRIHGSEGLMRIVERELRKIALIFVPVEEVTIWSDEPAFIRVPAYQLLEVPRAVEHMIDVFRAKATRGIFEWLDERLMWNMRSVTPVAKWDDGDGALVRPTQMRTSDEDVLRDYLMDIPLQKLFMRPVPVRWDVKDRLRHTHILGSSGAGKTTLLANMIHHDISAKRPPSLVIIDPHSSLITTFKEMKYPDNRRVILIDPRDIEHPPAINPFAISSRRLGSYTQLEREQLTQGALETITYVLTALGMEMTGKQETFFKYLVALLLSFPATMNRNATILDMLRLMDEAEYARPAIEAMPEVSRAFLERELLGSEKSRGNYSETKEQIRVRLDGILANNTLARMFTTTENKIDFYSELNAGSTILVDTADDFLGEGSAVFGSMVIAMVQQGLKERAARIPEADRYPTFMYVDEAHNYFSSKTEKILTDFRKLGCGCVFAHHQLRQCSEDLQASLMSNTAVKFAHTSEDANRMARAMRTTPAFIGGLGSYTWGVYIEGLLTKAVAFPVSRPRPTARKSEAEMAAFITQNRRFVSSATAPPPNAARPSPPPPPNRRPPPTSNDEFVNY